ncbi:dystrobrevin Hypothetical protein protein 1 [Nesidiocoris tenuis]|uniref:Biogenesis of lysosome-related organelles complex 1 subunit 5 n=1 Tax=Nesidiocoris tenuis TaxID=355587 RepID=A0ABN7BDA1_9HEMI|nr:dystrobrevin Hypothetical protein protein 1 [Nesidiocoris tenuis]
MKSGGYGLNDDKDNDVTTPHTLSFHLPNDKASGRTEIRREIVSDRWFSRNLVIPRMLSSIIEKINNVQDGISSSFKGLAVGQPLPKEKPESTVGSAVLSRYENSWMDLTNAAEYNANLARDIGRTISIFHNSIRRKRQIWSSFKSECQSLDDVIVSTESVVNMIGKLRMDIAGIEEDLIRLENLIECEEFYKKRDLEKMKLNLYREQKLENLDNFRASLSMKHTEKMKRKEEQESYVKQVKTEVLEERFKQDMENFKSFGVLPESNQRQERAMTSSLDDIVLEQDTDSLAKYLDDS